MFAKKLLNSITSKKNITNTAVSTETDELDNNLVIIHHLKT